MSARSDRGAAAAAMLSASLLHTRRLGRVLGPTVDLCCAAGPRQALRAWRAERLLEASDGDPSLIIYQPIWEQAAAALGAECSDRGSGFLQIRAGGREALVWRNLVPLDNPVTLRLAGDKPAVHRILASAGLPTPQFATFDRNDLRGAVRFLDEREGPCVIKPAFGTGRGRGVSCGARTRADLRRAAVWAARWGHKMLIERQGEGTEYRILALDGQVLDVVERRPPRVTGDGRRSVAELIYAENARRAESDGALGLFPITINLDCLLALRDAGLTLGSVPGRDVEVAVKHAANENAPADNQSVLGDAGPGFLADMCAASHALGVRLASFEVVALGIGGPLSQSHGMIVEVNTTPGLHYHYQVAGEPVVPVAIPILRTLLGDDEQASHSAIPPVSS